MTDTATMQTTIVDQANQITALRRALEHTTGLFDNEVDSAKRVHEATLKDRESMQAQLIDKEHEIIALQERNERQKKKLIELRQYGERRDTLVGELKERNERQKESLTELRQYGEKQDVMITELKAYNENQSDTIQGYMDRALGFDARIAAMESAVATAIESYRALAEKSDQPIWHTNHTIGVIRSMAHQVEYKDTKDVKAFVDEVLNLPDFAEPSKLSGSAPSTVLLDERGHPEAEDWPEQAETPFLTSEQIGAVSTIAVDPAGPEGDYTVEAVPTVSGDDDIAAAIGEHCPAPPTQSAPWVQHTRETYSTGYPDKNGNRT